LVSCLTPPVAVNCILAGLSLPELTTPQKHHSFRLLAYLEKGGAEVVEMVHKGHDANLNLLISCFVRRCRSVWLMTAVIIPPSVLICERREKRLFGPEALQSGEYCACDPGAKSGEFVNSILYLHMWRRSGGRRNRDGRGYSVMSVFWEAISEYHVRRVKGVTSRFGLIRVQTSLDGSLRMIGL
jgi:hypothetical protein